MSPQAWALVGVLVGAFAGSVAQVVADHLRHKRDTRQAMRATRRELFVRYLKVCDDTGLQWGIAAAMPREAQMKLLPSVIDTTTQLAVIVSEVALIAPRDTWRAARDLAVQVVDAVYELRAAKSPEEFARVKRQRQRTLKRPATTSSL